MCIVAKPGALTGARLRISLFVQMERLFCSMGHPSRPWPPQTTNGRDEDDRQNRESSTW